MLRISKLAALLILTASLFSFGASVANAQQPAEPGQQTVESLKGMLENLGYAPQELKNDKGQIARYLINVQSSGNNWKVLVEISPNQENLWVYANLAVINDYNQVPREILADMLKMNEKIGPSYFAYNEKAKNFVIYHAVTNRGVTAKLLRERIEHVARQVDVNERLWRPTLWSTGPGPGPVTISPEVQRLINDLASADDIVRMRAAKELGKQGSAARPAIPALQRLLQDPDEDVRRVAGNAIERIQGTPGPGPEPGPGNTVAGTLWEGTESLAGFGKLTFRFEPNGKAVMIDAVSTTNGNWSQSGDQVTVTFGNCVYTGTIQGQTMAGNARFTVGEPRPWTFSLTRAGPTAHSSGVKREPGPIALGGRQH